MEHEDLDPVGPELREALVEVGGDVGRRDPATERAGAFGRPVVMGDLRDDDGVVPVAFQAGAEDPFALAVGPGGVEEVPAQLEPGVRQRLREPALVVRPPGGPEREPREVAAERGEAL
jgi:hypothetical protein